MAGTYTKLIYHLIFSTKHREPLISPRLRAELYAYIGGILRDQNGHLLDVGGMPDYLHLLIRIKPDISASEIVRLVKANSSKWVNERPDQTGRFAWQRGYGVFTVSLSQALMVSQYGRRSPVGAPGRRSASSNCGTHLLQVAQIRVPTGERLPFLSKQAEAGG